MVILLLTFSIQHTHIQKIEISYVFPHLTRFLSQDSVTLCFAFWIFLKRWHIRSRVWSVRANDSVFSSAELHEDFSVGEKMKTPQRSILSLYSSCFHSFFFPFNSYVASLVDLWLIYPLFCTFNFIHNMAHDTIKRKHHLKVRIIFYATLCLCVCVCFHCVIITSRFIIGHSRALKAVSI